jgi:hypothetical protein
VAAVGRGPARRRDRQAGTYLAYIPDPLGPTADGPRAQQAAEDALAVPARADGRIGARGATSITC